MGLSAVDMEVLVPAGAQLDGPLEQGPERGESGSEDGGRPRWRGCPARWRAAWSGDSTQRAVRAVQGPRPQGGMRPSVRPSASLERHLPLGAGKYGPRGSGQQRRGPWRRQSPGLPRVATGPCAEAQKDRTPPAKAGSAWGAPCRAVGMPRMTEPRSQGGASPQLWELPTGLRPPPGFQMRLSEDVQPPKPGML